MEKAVTATLAKPIRVSSAPLAPGEIVRGHEGFMKLNMELDFENRSPTRRKFSVVAKSFGSVGVGHIDGTPSSFSRRQPHLADGRDLISVSISGGGRFEADGMSGLDRYAAHGAVILESRRVSTLYSLDDTTAWTVCMERAPIEPLLATVDGPIQRCVGCDNPGIRLLQGYLSCLFALEKDCDLTLATLHVRDLVLYALGVRGDAQALVRERGVQAARQSAVVDAIALRAGEPDLDPASVAARLGMSLRYLHKLLEPTGRSFAQHLLRQRLDRAVEMLRHQECAHLKIAEVAARSGFRDISHFNRSFRHAFGDTPYGVRVRAARASRAQEP